MRTIWYMGAKTRMAEDILAAVEEADPRAEAVLDLMSGTAVVAQTLAGRYRVAANDVQAYAAAIASAYLLRPLDEPAFHAALDPERDLGAAYRQNAAALLEPLAEAVAREDAFLEAAGLTPEAPDPCGELFPAPSPARLLTAARREVPREPQARARAYRAFALTETPRFHEDTDAACQGPFRAAAALYTRRAVQERRADPGRGPALLATVYWPNVYLGLRQAIAVDSLRRAIDALPTRGPWAAARRRLYLAALLHAVSVSTSATSHFCQPRGLGSEAEVEAVLARRAVSIPSRFLGYVQEIAATAASNPLRGDHQVFNGDWRQVYARWDEVEADVVYADPPYTADNYSRFYHALEVLTRYDYPALQRAGRTKGRYPAIDSRHRSAFCGRGQVEAELRALMEETAARGAALVLSYGAENGLLLRRYREAGLGPNAALQRFAALAEGAYREVEVRRRTLLHSGQGDSNHKVTELLLVARGPRRRGRARRCG